MAKSTLSVGLHSHPGFLDSIPVLVLVASCGREFGGIYGELRGIVWAWGWGTLNPAISHGGVIPGSLVVRIPGVLTEGLVLGRKHVFALLPSV